MHNLIAGNDLQTRREGMQTLLLTTYLQGEACQAMRFVVALATVRQAAPTDAFDVESAVLTPRARKIFR